MPRLDLVEEARDRASDHASLAIDHIIHQYQLSSLCTTFVSEQSSADSMPHPSESATIWTVRTTKRKIPASELQARKRSRLSNDENNTPDKSSAPQGSVARRQQTLTQIHAPLRSTLDNGEEDYYDEGLKPMEAARLRDMNMVEQELSGKGARRPTRSAQNSRSRPKTPKFGKRQRSTLTQMDFVKLGRGGSGVPEVDVKGDEELEMIGNGQNLEEGASLAQKYVDADVQWDARKAFQPNGRREESSASAMRRKKRRLSKYRVENNNGEWHETPPTLAGRRRPKLGSTLTQNTVQAAKENAPLCSRRQTRSATRAKARKFESDSHLSGSFSDKENAGVCGGSARIKVYETPKVKRTIIPSSQSPESLVTGSRGSSSPASRRSRLAPLQGQSLNVTPTTSSRFILQDCSPTKQLKSPKRKTCVLKYTSGRLREVDEPQIDDLQPETHPQSTKRPSRVPLVFQGQIDNENSRKSASSNAKSPSDPEIPESSQIVQDEAILLSHGHAETEVEIPETSQGLRHVTSNPSIIESGGDFRLLSSEQNTSLAAGRVRSSEVGIVDCPQDIQGYGCGASHGDQAMGCFAIPTTPSSRSHVATGGHILQGGLLRRGRTTSTIDDSQAEDDSSDIRTELPLSTDDKLRCKDDSLAEPASARPPTLPTPPPAIPQSTSYISETTTLVPTKLPCPSLAPSSPPASSAVRIQSSNRPTPTTQRSIHPASMARPSQVSTQSPTQPSWLPSGTAATDTSPTSPTNAPRAVSNPTIIKNSNSGPELALQDIPTLSQLNGTEAADNTRRIHPAAPGRRSDTSYLLDRNDDLDPASSPSPSPEQKQQEPPPLPPSSSYYYHYPSFTHHHPNSLSPPSKPNRQPKSQCLPENPDPLPSLHLADSLLESIPGPPPPGGWSTGMEVAHEYEHEHGDEDGNGDWEEMGAM